MPDYSQALIAMVQCQLNPSGVITPAIVDAFMAVPRELFLPADRQAMAYTDDHIDLGGGRVLARPLLLGQMIEAVRPQASDRALCVGGATGYGAAVMAELCSHVVDLEGDDRFGPLNHAALVELGVTHISRLIGDIKRGVPGATYDVIIAEGAYSDFPQELAERLAPGGRMACLVVPSGKPVGTVYLTERSASGHLASRPLGDAYMPYLPGCQPAERFAFG